jgi:peptidyl-tRNA hydrolase, PTH1 family
MGLSWLIVGLGNPGQEYTFNRHNLGFLFIDRLQDVYGGNDFKKNKWNGLMAEGKIADQNCIFLKPQSYMNLSGPSVQGVANFYKIPMDRVIVIHDDLDLIVADIKIKQGGGNGGHNGLKSIDAHLGQSYWRIRLGIGHPGHRDQVSSYVLNNIPKVEIDGYVDLFDRMCDQLPILIKDGQVNSPKFLSEVKSK